MDVLAQLLSLSNIILCLAIVALVWAQRRMVELFIPWLGHKVNKEYNLSKSKLWTEFLVPIGPLGSGMLLMLVPDIPVPELFAASIYTKMVFGLGLGLVSGLVYRLVKKNVLDKLGKSHEASPYIDEPK